MCKFCEAMESGRKADDISRTYYPDQECRYSVAIVKRYFMKGRKGCYHRSTDYRIRGCGYALNFCPECGNKIGRREEATAEGFCVETKKGLPHKGAARRSTGNRTSK